MNLQSQICQVKVTIKLLYNSIIPQGPRHEIANIKALPHFVLSWYHRSTLVYGKCKCICHPWIMCGRGAPGQTEVFGMRAPAAERLQEGRLGASEAFTEASRDIRKADVL